MPNGKRVWSNLFEQCVMLLIETCHLWNGGTYTYCLYLTVPTVLYAQIYQQLEEVRTKIGDKLLPLWKSYTEDWFGSVQITPALDISDDWQEKAKAWLAGKNVTNQGRVRSEKLASRSLFAGGSIIAESNQILSF